MKLGTFFTFVLAVGLGLLLALAVGALDRDGGPLAADTEAADLVLENPPKLNDTSQITFTPVSTAYLSVIVNGYCLPLHTDDFDDPASGWPVVDGGSVQQGYLDGEYRIAIAQPTYRVVATPGFKATDYTVTVDVRNLSYTDSGSYGLAFGLSDDGSQFYTFEINANSFYALSRYSSGSPTLLDFGTSSHIHPYTRTNTLKVERNGSQIDAYINDHLVTSVSDSTYTGLRRVGVTAHSAQALDVRFDRFAVYALTCGTPAGSSALESQTSSVKRQTSNAKRQTSNVKREM